MIKKIRIVYLFRDKSGVTRASYLFNNEILKDKLEYMYPGEVLLNMSQSEITEMLLKDSM